MNNIININNSCSKQNAFYKKVNINNKELLNDKIKIKLKFNEMSDKNSFSNTKKNSQNDNIYINDINNRSKRESSPLVVNRQQNRKSIQYNKHKQFRSLNKNIYLRPRSLEKIKLNNTEENDKKEINQNFYNPHFTSNCDTNSKERKKKNNYNYKKNNVIYLNITNYRNINPINPIVLNTEGSENQYEPIINDDNDVNEFNLDEKLLDTKIKSLEKERDFVVKNIINKYQNKIEKISKEKNNLLLKYSLRNENISLKNYKNPIKKYSNTSMNNFGNIAINSIKNKYDYTISTTTSNK